MTNLNHSRNLAVCRRAGRLCGVLMLAANTPAQTFTTLHDFVFPDGAASGLIVSSNALYGTTSGDISDGGTVFKVNTDAYVDDWSDSGNTFYQN